MTLKDIIRFNNLLLDFQKVERVLYVPGTDRKENDFEHSYQLTMLAWYILEHGNFSLDTHLVIKYALIHDLVEVYAGDVPFHASKEERLEKVEREKKAATKLSKQFPKFKELHVLVKQYEAKENSESKFVGALDTIVPMLNIYADGGRAWREQGVTLDEEFVKRKKTVCAAPELEPYLNDIIEMLQKEPELFPDSKSK